MQRDILFRSWNSLFDEFFYFKNGKYFEDIECKKESINNSHFSWLSAEQDTGLKDKNGVKIFEGDLLDDSYNDDDGNLIEDHSEVIFNVLKGEWSIDNSFKKDKSSLTNLVRCFGSELKVIGNIHENEK